MPKLIADIIVAGTLGATDQPVLRIDDELELRPFVVGDVGTVVTAFSTPDIQFFHFRHLDLVEAVEWIEQCGNAWRSERSATWAIIDRRNARVLGRVTIHLSLAEGHGEVSYWVLPEGRGRGVASRACVAATMWAHSVGLRRVELQRSTTNTASHRVAMRAGFREEGVRREALLHTDGWHDMVLYSHLASDVPVDGDLRTSASPALGPRIRTLRDVLALMPDFGGWSLGCRIQTCESAWDPRSLLTLETRMDSWQPVERGAGRRSIRSSCVSERSGWCWTSAAKPGVTSRV